MTITAPSANARHLECFYLGAVLDTHNCRCPGKWLRECDLFGQCTLGDPNAGVPVCKTCDKYTAEPPTDIVSSTH